MKSNRILLSGAASIALLGAMALAEPACAQSNLNPPQYSSPAERTETRQLNEQNLNGTDRSPAELNGEQVNTGEAQPDDYGSEQPPYGSEQSQYESPQQPDGQQMQYQRQMQRYEDQQQDYRDQRARYENEKDRYRRNLRWYDQARWAYDYPRPFSYEFDKPRLERLYLMTEHAQELAGVPIESPTGVWVGRIRNIETAPDGRPARVEVALNRRVSVWVDPRDLRLDPRERVAYTDLTRDDLWQLPGASVEDGPV